MYGDYPSTFDFAKLASGLMIPVAERRQAVERRECESRQLIMNSFNVLLKKEAWNSACK